MSAPTAKWHCSNCKAGATLENPEANLPVFAELLRVASAHRCEQKPSRWQRFGSWVLDYSPHAVFMLSVGAAAAILFDARHDHGLMFAGDILLIAANANAALLCVRMVMRAERRP